jgi:hypothetical protein
MIQFVCDTCAKVKRAGDAWILGLAAENIGVKSARREVDILSAWAGTEAVNHFCSVKCKDQYVAKAFGEKSA